MACTLSPSRVERVRITYIGGTITLATACVIEDMEKIHAILFAVTLSAILLLVTGHRVYLLAILISSPILGWVIAPKILPAAEAGE